MCSGSSCSQPHLCVELLHEGVCVLSPCVVFDLAKLVRPLVFLAYARVLQAAGGGKHTGHGGCTCFARDESNAHHCVSHDVALGEMMLGQENQTIKTQNLPKSTTL